MCERASSILKHCAKMVIIGFLKVIFSLDEFNIVGTNQLYKRTTVTEGNKLLRSPDQLPLEH